MTGQPMLDFSIMDKNRQHYFTAIQAGLDNEVPMRELFKKVLQITQQSVSN